MKIKYYFQKFLGHLLDAPIIPSGRSIGYSLVKSEKANTTFEEHTRIYPPFFMHNVSIGMYSYIAHNCRISNTKIGRFCSIGPNFNCGLGIHPTNGISTAPMFYSTAKQNGETFCTKNRFIETKSTSIGNDVFIGANVTILDGVTIADGAVIGAGAVVTSDIPPYAIAVGVPAKIIKYRFNEDVVSKLLKSRWWEKSDDKNMLIAVEKYFNDIDTFLDSFE